MPLSSLRSFLLSCVFAGFFIAFGVFPDFTGDCSSFYNESPILKELVEKGKLPSVEDRLPIVPVIIKPVNQTGKYGGVWHRGMVGSRDHANFVRTIGYENLMRWDQQWTRAIPNVALSVSVNSNSTEYVFRLRKGMRWSDGVSFTADDILFWFEDVYSNTSFTNVGLIWLLGEKNNVNVTKLAEDKVAFHFKEPNGLFLQNLANPRGSAPTSYPKHYLKQFHPKYNPDVHKLAAKEGVSNWVELFEMKFGKVSTVGVDHPSRWSNPELPTLNPWILESGYSDNQKSFVADRNPFYWKVDVDGNQLPYIDKVVFDVAENRSELLQWAIDGKLDMQLRHFATNEHRPIIESGMEQGGYHLFDVIPSDSNMMVISLNLNHRDPSLRSIFRDKNFRIGLSHAIDRQKIIDTVLNGSGKPYQAAPLPDSPHYHEKLAHQYTEYSTDLAQQYLDKANLPTGKDGYRLKPDGDPLAFTLEIANALYPEWQPMAEMIGQFWHEVGIDVEVKIESRELFSKRKENALHDATAWIAPGGLDVIQDPRYYFPQSISDSDYAIRWARWYENNNDLEADEPPAQVKKQMVMFNALKKTNDADEQGRLMKIILDIAADQFYVIGVATPQDLYGVVKNNFKNVPILMPAAWIYPTPAPTNPCQYYVD